MSEMRPLRKRGLYRQLDDIKEESSHIQEVMAYTHERNVKKRQEEKKAKKKSPKEILNMILMHEERKSREDFDERRIVFLDGGFGEYEDSVRMLTGMVLLKQRPVANEKDGIVFADSHLERHPEFEVVAAGEGCDDVVPGQVVMVDTYSGTEIVSGKDLYRIVSIADVLCVLEDFHEGDR